MSALKTAPIFAFSITPAFVVPPKVTAPPDSIFTSSRIRILSASKTISPEPLVVIDIAPSSTPEASFLLSPNDNNTDWKVI